jgi:hypothetical protein
MGVVWQSVLLIMPFFGLAAVIYSVWRITRPPQEGAEPVRGALTALAAGVMMMVIPILIMRL